MKKILPFFFLLSCGLARGQEKTVFTAIDLGADTVLTWRVSNDKAGVLYIIQQNRWNSWKDLDTLGPGKDADSASYSYAVRKYLVAGENKFRVRAAADKMLVFSKIIKVNSSRSPSKKDIRQKVSARSGYVVELGRQEYFEVYDKFNKCIKKGVADKVDFSGLSPDVYYLNYGDVSTEIMVH
jgi:hypothetical protein